MCANVAVLQYIAVHGVTFANSGFPSFNLDQYFFLALAKFRNNTVSVKNSSTTSHAFNVLIFYAITQYSSTTITVESSLSSTVQYSTVALLLDSYCTADRPHCDTPHSTAQHSMSSYNSKSCSEFLVDCRVFAEPTEEPLCEKGC